MGNGAWKKAVVVLLAVLATAAIATLLAGYLGAKWGVSWLRSHHEKVATARASRESLITEVAPAKMPESLPLLGPEGKGSDGYPTQYVDVPGIRSLLYHERFSELTSYFEQFQSAFEADQRKEYWLMDAADAFFSSEPELDARLDAWVKAAPGSFAPYLARGTHYVAVGYARRGGKWAKDTAGEDFNEMSKSLEQAIADLDKAIWLHPHLVAALRRKIAALTADCDTVEGKKALDDALAYCPSCYQVRVAYMSMIVPRWCGSYEEMASFAHYRDDGSNPRIALLEGYADLDRADMLRLDAKYPEALTAIERACSVGENWEFLLEKAKIELAMKQDAAAFGDINRAIELRPGKPQLLFRRALQEETMHQWEPAGRDLLEGLRSDPTDSLGRSIFENVVQGVTYIGWESYKAGHTDDALRLLDLAADLSPYNHDIQTRRTWIVMHPDKAAPESSLEIKDTAGAVPDDFRACQQLDYAMARQGRYKDVIAMWDKFIAMNPGEGRAYLERGGAHYRMGQLNDALADAKKACDLGVSEGCARAKEIEARVR